MKMQKYKNSLNPAVRVTSVFMLSALIAVASGCGGGGSSTASNPAPHQPQPPAPIPHKSALVMRLRIA